MNVETVLGVHAVKANMNLNPKILIVDDDKSVADGIEAAFQNEGYDTYIAYTGQTAIEIIKSVGLDAMIIERSLPDISTYDICKFAREQDGCADCYIMMLADSANDTDLVIGFRAGVDGYLAKPVSLIHLLLRIKTSLRREISHYEPNTVISGSDEVVELFDGLNLNVARKTLTCKGVKLQLAPKEFELLAFLTKNPRVTFSRDELLNAIWGYEFAGGTRTVDIHMSNLRSKLADFPNLIDRLKTIRSIGYRYE